MNNKQTAVEFLISKLQWTYVDFDTFNKYVQKAKEMHEQEIIEAYRLGHIFHDSNDSNSAQEYYDTEYDKR
jgi:hypothetical protein